MPPDTDSTQQLTYSGYLKVPELLELQTCLTEPSAHDELQFIIVHQVYELWFKLVLHEIDEIQELLQVGDEPALRAVIRLCRRIEEILKVLVGQIHVLETMRPADFMKFRTALNPASGFQSVQFREAETALGLVDEVLASFTAKDPRHHKLRERMAAPTVSDQLYAFLRAQGMDVTPPGPERSEAEDDTTLEAFRRIYDAPDEKHLIYDLCEALVEVDEQLILWRRHHVMMVERQIGDKPGTGKGTTGNEDGIRYLQTTLTRRVFPDLWSVRTLLTD
jgi:tryptophan 2,3-dioxygenase